MDIQSSNSGTITSGSTIVCAVTILESTICRESVPRTVLFLICSTFSLHFHWTGVRILWGLHTEQGHTGPKQKANKQAIPWQYHLCWHSALPLSFSVRLLTHLPTIGLFLHNFGELLLGLFWSNYCHLKSSTQKGKWNLIPTYWILNTV